MDPRYTPMPAVSSDIDNSRWKLEGVGKLEDSEESLVNTDQVVLPCSLPWLS